MTSAAKALVAAQMSGFCGHSGFHAECRRNPWCACPCHTEASEAAVNGGDAVPGPADPSKDALQAVPFLTAGVPAAASRLDLDAIDLTGTVAGLSRDVAASVDGLTELEALDALAVVRAARQDLAQIEATLERHAARVMTGNIVEWPGGVAERRFGKDRKAWQHDELVRQVVNLIAVDVATDKTSGETDDMLAALVQDACARFAETHRPDWRVTSLKHMGIEPDEFCESIPGRTTIQITQAGPQ